MRLLCALAIVAILAVSGDAKKKRKFEGDFEFAEEVTLIYLFDNIVF